MRVSVELEDGFLPDRFGKHAARAYQLEGRPIRSFPLEIVDAPARSESFALSFVDFDAVPVCGFCWIHWLACNFAPTTLLIPENASASGEVACVQGSNSNFSPLAGNLSDPALVRRYCGPRPPDKAHDYTLRVYALDAMLDLQEGYLFNEFRRAVRGHVLDTASVELPSRA